MTNCFSPINTLRHSVVKLFNWQPCRFLFSHQQQLFTISSAAYHLADITSQLNASLMTQSEELSEIDRFTESSRGYIYDLFELLSTEKEVTMTSQGRLNTLRQW